MKDSTQGDGPSNFLQRQPRDQSPEREAAAVPECISKANNISNADNRFLLTTAFCGVLSA
jgi:hypothetical protein